MRDTSKGYTKKIGIYELKVFPCGSDWVYEIIIDGTYGVYDTSCLSTYQEALDDGQKSFGDLINKRNACDISGKCDQNGFNGVILTTKLEFTLDTQRRKIFDLNISRCSVCGILDKRAVMASIVNKLKCFPEIDGYRPDEYEKGAKILLDQIITH